jgi:hypothetical protein
MLPSRHAIRATGFVKNSPSTKEEHTMKKLMLLTLALFSFLATARTVKTGDAPFPTCNPCDWVR